MPTENQIAAPKQVERSTVTKLVLTHLLPPSAKDTI